MARIFQNHVLWLVILAMLQASCIKEYSIENLGSNQAPNASSDEDISVSSNNNIPGPISADPDHCLDGKDTIELNGSLSSDPDGQIVSYQWSYLNNHPSNTGSDPVLLNAKQPVTSVILEQPGDYWFSLTVTDNLGATDIDSIRVSNQANATVQLLNPVYLGTMKESNVINIVNAGNKLFIQYQVDSLVDNNSYTLSTDRIKTFDFDTKSWADLHLPFYRSGLSMVSSGSKVFFSGGEINEHANSTHKQVDVFDITADQWSIIELPENFQVYFTTILDNKILFQGRNNQLGSASPINQIEILDLDTKTWTHTRMSQDRYNTNIAVAGNQILFAGGIYNSNSNNKIIDIYNLETNSWQVSSLNTSKSSPKGIFLNNKIYWVNTANITLENNPIEVWDINTSNSEFICLGDGLNNLFDYNHQLLVARNMSRFKSDTLHFKNIDLFKYDPEKNIWTIGRFPNTGKIIGGIGAIIGPPGQQRIIGVGYKEYPNVFWDVSFLYPQFDHEFYEISF